MESKGQAREWESQPGTPQLLRVMNERILLEHLRVNGPRSRAQLARETGLSKPTVSLALANLEQAALVRAIGQVGSERGGRQAVLYELNPTVGYVMGIDIGRSWVRIAIADLACRIVARRNIQNQAEGATMLVDTVAELAHEMVKSAGLTWTQILHVVVGTPGVLDREGGHLLFAPNLPEWSQQGLIEKLRVGLGTNFTVDNDANLAALGEHTFGRGVGVATFVFLTVGTGVGMGIVINGTLYRGAHGLSGEVGFLPLEAQGEPKVASAADASRRGILETVAAADGVVQAARASGMRPPLSAKRIFDAARNGDEQALVVVEYEARQLARVVASVVAILDPELVVLGGGVGHNIDLLRNPLEHYLKEITPLRAHIVASKLGEDAVLLGALSTALEVARDLVFQQRTVMNASSLL